MATQIERIISALQRGTYADRDALAAAAGIDPVTQTSTILALMRRKGLVTYDTPTKTSIDYSSIRIVADQAKAAAPRRDRKPAKTSTAVKPAAAPLPPPSESVSLVGAISVTYDAEEIADLEARAVAAEEHARWLRGQVDAIKAHRPLGPDEAYLIGLVAKLHKAG